MKKNKTNEFTSEYTLDKDTFKEFQMGFSQNKMILVYIVCIVVSLFYLILKRYNSAVFFSIFSMAYILILNLIKLYTSKLQYNRFLIVTKGKNKNNIKISENIIEGTNENGNKNSYTLDQIIDVVETKNLIILKLKYRLGIIINKNTLNTSKNEFIDYLMDKCINLKSRKIKKTINYLNLLIMFYTILVTILFLALFLK